jgi:multidrug resistance efflux pump
MDLIPYFLTNYSLENYLLKVRPESRIIYWIIIILVVLGISVLPFIYVDVSVQAKGFFQTEIEKQSICAPFQGKVVFTSIKNGNSIIKGDTLLIIDSETNRAQKSSIQKKIQSNNAAISDLGKLISIETPDIQLEATNFYLNRYFTEYSNMLKLWVIQMQKYQRCKSEYERNELLHDQEIIPDAEFENILFSYRSEEENLKQILIYHKSMWQADLMTRKNDAGTLLAELEHYSEELNNRIILAPVSGEIIQSSDIQEGTIVGLNQKIAEISPMGQLVATCFVKPNDIGLINMNQNVRIQVDAFNYNEWGFINATIADISDDMIIEDGSTAYFRIRCKPEKTFLTLKNGIIADIKKGMTFNARIVLIKRSLFNLLFDKADKWLNPYLNNEN